MNILGPKDMLVASNFLCHMATADAEKCLRNIAQLVNPGGYLFVSGVDLDVRTKVALDLGSRISVSAAALFFDLGSAFLSVSTVGASLAVVGA
jgi:2-polyprenyl-3-methyl-5-hydroxy-6-metoxy-1,4-benzoquinol methylase